MGPEPPLHEQEAHSQTLKPATADDQNPPSTPNLLPTTSFSRDPSSLHLRAASGSSTRSDAQTHPSVLTPGAGAERGRQSSSPGGLDHDSPVPSPRQSPLDIPIPSQLTGGSQDAFWENPWQTPAPGPQQNAMSTGGSSTGNVQFQSNNPFRRAIEQRSSLQSLDGLAGQVQAPGQSGGNTPAPAWTMGSDTPLPPNPPAQAPGYGGDHGTYQLPLELLLMVDALFNQVSIRAGTESVPFVDGLLQQTLTGSSYSGAGVYPHDARTPLLPPKLTGTQPAGQPSGGAGSEDLYASTQVGYGTVPSTSTSDLIDFGDEQSPSRAQVQQELSQQSSHTGEPPGPLEQIPESRPPSYGNDAQSAELLQPRLTLDTPASPPRAPTPVTEAQIRQRERILAETYDIRKVNWDDGLSGLRESPMLVQNENGPCPLLALVNGMVMRARPDTDSPLVKILASKEKISVEMLIHVLFEELTTCVGENELPDIEDLGSFLTVLHTGMNVNPRLTAVSLPSRFADVY